MGIPRETEAGFMKAVIQYARLRGWRVWHDTDSRKNAAGFPDLHMVRCGQVVYAELKTARGKVRPEQAEYLAELGRVAEASNGAVRVFLWRPSDWERIRAELE